MRIWLIEHEETDVGDPWGDISRWVRGVFTSEAEAEHFCHKEKRFKGRTIKGQPRQFDIVTKGCCKVMPWQLDGPTDQEWEGHWNGWSYEGPWKLRAPGGQT